MQIISPLGKKINLEVRYHSELGFTVYHAPVSEISPPYANNKREVIRQLYEIHQPVIQLSNDDEHEYILFAVDMPIRYGILNELEPEEASYVAGN